jgi:cyanophycinase
MSELVIVRYPFLALVTFLFASVLAATDYDNAPTVGPAKGWLVIQGGENVTSETKERFVTLAGGPYANFVVIPTADERDVNPGEYGAQMARFFDVETVTVLHTRDRVRADSPGFVEPLRRASGVWIGGGRPYRLADAYLGTAVEREIKALLARGGVVGGGSAGATIQGSFLVRGAPSEDNTVMVSPEHTVGFGLLPKSAIDQHVHVRGRERDLDPVIAKNPDLLGLGIDQGTAIVVHGDSFFVVGGQVAIHDGKMHHGEPYYFLSSGQSYNLKSRSPEVQEESPLALRVITAQRTRSTSFLGVVTTGSGVLESRNTSESRAIHYECGVSLYNVGNDVYPARPDGERQIKIRAREVNTDQLREYTCKF